MSVAGPPISLAPSPAEGDLLVECLRAASRDDWSAALTLLCRAACLLVPSESAAVFARPNGSLRCLASFRVDGPNVEELARRLGKLSRGGGGQKLDSFTVFPLPVEPHWDAGFVLGTNGSALLGGERLAAILDAAASIVDRKVRDAERQRVRRERLSGAQSYRRELEHLDARTHRVQQDLKAPLASMRSHIDQLLRGMAGPLSSQMQGYLQQLSHSLEEQRALIDSELSTGPDGLALVDVDHLFRRVLQRAAVFAAGRGIGVSVDAWRVPVWVRADRSLLELLFRVLVRIAVRQTRSLGRVDARLRADEDWAIADFRSDVPWQAKVVEFRICQEIVRRHQGQLFVSEGRDVLVQVRLPLERNLERWLLNSPPLLSATLRSRRMPA